MSTTTRPLRVSLCKRRRERTQQGSARTKEGLLLLLLLLQLSRGASRKDQCVLHLTTTRQSFTAALTSGLGFHSRTTGSMPLVARKQ